MYPWIGLEETKRRKQKNKGGEREEGKENLGWVSLSYVFIVFLSGHWMGSEPGPAPIHNLYGSNLA